MVGRGGERRRKAIRWRVFSSCEVSSVKVIVDESGEWRVLMGAL